MKGEFIANSFVGVDKNNNSYDFKENGTVSVRNRDKGIDSGTIVKSVERKETILSSEAIRSFPSTEVASALAISQADSPAPGPADVFATFALLQAFVSYFTNESYEQTIGVNYFAKDAGKNERHGEGGRGLTKAEKQIADLESQLANASGNKARKIGQKIKNVRENANSKKKGEEHSRTNKR